MQTRMTLAASAVLALGTLFAWLTLPTPAQEKKAESGAKSEPLAPAQLAERAEISDRQVIDPGAHGGAIGEAGKAKRRHRVEPIARHQRIAQVPETSRHEDDDGRSHQSARARSPRFGRNQGGEGEGQEF